MAKRKRSMQIDDDVHKRLAHYGRLTETFSQAMDRALDEAGAPKVDELEELHA
jgi:hypothetical protein